MPAFPEHEDRAAVLAELHLRPFLQFSTPHSFRHFAFVINPLGAAAEMGADHGGVHACVLSGYRLSGDLLP